MQIPIHPMMGERPGTVGAPPEGAMPANRHSGPHFAFKLESGGGVVSIPWVPHPPAMRGLPQQVGLSAGQAVSPDLAGAHETTAEGVLQGTPSSLSLTIALPVINGVPTVPEDKPVVCKGQPGDEEEDVAQFVPVAETVPAGLSILPAVPDEAQAAEEAAFKLVPTEGVGRHRGFGPPAAEGTAPLTTAGPESATDGPVAVKPLAGTVTHLPLAEARIPETLALPSAPNEKRPPRLPGKIAEDGAVEVRPNPVECDGIAPPEQPPARSPARLPEQARHEAPAFAGLQLPPAASERAVQRSRLGEVLQPLEGHDAVRAAPPPARPDRAGVPGVSPAVALAISGAVTPVAPEHFEPREGDPLEIGPHVEPGAPEGDSHRRLQPVPAAADRVGRSVVAQIAQAVARPGADGTVEIRLQPEELGRVRLTFVHTDSGVTVAVMAERPETLDLMRRNIDMLETDLRGSGFASLEFSFGHDGQAGDMGGEAPDLAGDASPSLAEATAVRVELQVSSGPIADGRVDIRM